MLEIILLINRIDGVIIEAWCRNEIKVGVNAVVNLNIIKLNERNFMLRQSLSEKHYFCLDSIPMFTVKVYLQMNLEIF